MFMKSKTILKTKNQPSKGKKKTLQTRNQLDALYNDSIADSIQFYGGNMSNY
jgi:hypothetical protein